jgi:phage gp36-like protein
MPKTDVRQLVDDEASGDEIVENDANLLYSRLLACMKKADNTIDSYCRGRYTVPFTEVPETIKDISISLTVVYLYERRMDLNESEVVRSRYKNAIQILEHIQDGRIRLFDDVRGPANYRTNKRKSDRVFTRDRLDTF